MDIESILNSNDIAVSIDRVSWSKEDLYWREATKTYVVYVANNRKNIKAEFRFKWPKEPSKGRAIFDLLIFIANSKNNASNNFSTAVELKELISLEKEFKNVLAEAFGQILDHMASSEPPIMREVATLFDECPKEAIKKLMLDDDNIVRNKALKHIHAQGLGAFI